MNTGFLLDEHTEELLDEADKGAVGEESVVVSGPWDGDIEM